MNKPKVDVFSTTNAEMLIKQLNLSLCAGIKRTTQKKKEVQEENEEEEEERHNKILYHK